MSSINPNNIDGTYPIAGQDNDSQGFRDNFTNVKNNLAFAKTEIEDLQNNAILKTALSGGTLNNDMNYAQLKSAQLLKTVYTKNSLTTVSGSTTIDWSTGHFQNFITSGSVDLTFSGWPTSGLYTSLRLEANVTSVAHTISFAAGTTSFYNLSNIQGASGNTITLSSPGIHVFEFSTYNNGSTVYVRDLLRNYDITTAGATATYTDITITGNITAGNVRAPIIGNVGTTLTATNAYLNGTVLAGAINSPVIGNTGASITGGNIKSTSNIGYSGVSSTAVTQATNRGTWVTINQPIGNVVLTSGFIGAYSANLLVLNNTFAEPNDYISIQQGDMGNNFSYMTRAYCNTAGRIVVTISNDLPVNSPTEVINLRYAILKNG